MVAILKMPNVKMASQPVDSQNQQPPAPPHMRLVKDDDATGADRRIFPRKEVQLEARGLRLDHTVTARRAPFLSWEVRDLSLGGLSAMSPTPVERGERINVTFPSKGLAGGWDALGHVIRCDPSPMGYRVAMEFDPVPMAA
jgi:hypothetical protein